MPDLGGDGVPDGLDHLQLLTVGPSFAEEQAAQLVGVSQPKFESCRLSKVKRDQSFSRVLCFKLGETWGRPKLAAQFAGSRVCTEDSLAIQGMPCVQVSSEKASNGAQGSG